LIVKKDNSVELFDYKIKNANIKAAKDINLINKMRNYAFSNLQSFQYYMKESNNIIKR
jgi:hypothetical protein